ncbi:hypothetical protein HDV62DRAFT_286785 [Trichoderma sp. SZMC 28011]
MRMQSGKWSGEQGKTTPMASRLATTAATTTAVTRPVESTGDGDVQRKAKRGMREASRALLEDIHDISNLGERCETSVAGRQDWGHVGVVLADRRQNSHILLIHIEGESGGGSHGLRATATARGEEMKGEGRRTTREEAARQGSRNVEQRTVVCKDANWPRGGTGRVEIRMRKKKSNRRTGGAKQGWRARFWLCCGAVVL